MGRTEGRLGSVYESGAQTPARHVKREAVLSGMQKLNDKDTQSIGIEELHALIKVIDEDGMAALMSSICSTRAGKPHVRKEVLRLIPFVTGASSPMRGSVLGPIWLPKLLAYLRGRLKDSDAQVREVAGEVLGRVAADLLHCGGGAPLAADVDSPVLKVVLQTLAEPRKELQLASASALSHVAPSLGPVPKDTAKLLLKHLSAAAFHAKAALLRALVSVDASGQPCGLLVHNQDVFLQGRPSVWGSTTSGGVIGCACSTDWIDRKAAVEGLHALTLLLGPGFGHGSDTTRTEAAAAILATCKYDKVRTVRDAAAAALAAFDVTQPGARHVAAEGRAAWHRSAVSHGQRSSLTERFFHARSSSPPNAGSVDPDIQVFDSRPQSPDRGSSAAPEEREQLPAAAEAAAPLMDSDLGHLPGTLAYASPGRGSVPLQASIFGREREPMHAGGSFAPDPGPARQAWALEAPETSSPRQQRTPSPTQAPFLLHECDPLQTGGQQRLPAAVAPFGNLSAPAAGHAGDLSGRSMQEKVEYLLQFCSRLLTLVEVNQQQALDSFSSMGHRIGRIEAQLGLRPTPTACAVTGPDRQDGGFSSASPSTTAADASSPPPGVAGTAHNSDASGSIVQQPGPIAVNAETEEGLSDESAGLLDLDGMLGRILREQQNPSQQLQLLRTLQRSSGTWRELSSSTADQLIQFMASLLRDGSSNTIARLLPWLYRLADFDEAGHLCIRPTSQRELLSALQTAVQRLQSSLPPSSPSSAGRAGQQRCDLLEQLELLSSTLTLVWGNAEHPSIDS